MANLPVDPLAVPHVLNADQLIEHSAYVEDLTIKIEEKLSAIAIDDYRAKHHIECKIEDAIGLVPALESQLQEQEKLITRHSKNLDQYLQQMLSMLVNKQPIVIWFPAKKDVYVNIGDLSIHKSIFAIILQVLDELPHVSKRYRVDGSVEFYIK